MLPLARYRTADDPLLLLSDKAVSAATFFAQAQRLAAILPNTRHIINLCETRYGFMLGFAAALLRGQTSLLPSGQGRSDREQALQQYPDAWLLSDQPLAAARSIDLTPFLAADGNQVFPAPQIDEEMQAAILFTSGSTGRPTAHSKTWGQLYRGAQCLAAGLGWDNVSNRAIVGSIPSQHMFGLETTVLLPWFTGSPVHAQKPLLPADIDNVLRRSTHLNWWMTTPLHLHSPSHPLPGLAGIVASTMSLPASVARAAEVAWQVPVVEIYGSTETGALALRRTATEKSWLPLTGVALRHEVARGTRQTWSSGSHFSSPVVLGDELELLPEGRFLWLGRSGDLIKVGGKRTSLSNLNQQLTDIPGVDDGVYFLPRDDANDDLHPAKRMAAFFVSSTLSPEAVLKALRTRIDPVFLPRPLYRVAKLPRNANGKLPHAELAALLAQCRLRKKPALTIAANHPALAGHFPGNPVVPGVVILKHIVEAIGAAFPHIELDTLRSARFHAALKPGEAFSVHTQMKDTYVSFRVLLKDAEDDKGALIASGQWQYRSIPGPGADGT